MGPIDPCDIEIFAIELKMKLSVTFISPLYDWLFRFISSDNSDCFHLISLQYQRMVWFKCEIFTLCYCDCCCLQLFNSIVILSAINLATKLKWMSLLSNENNSKRIKDVDSYFPMKSRKWIYTTILRTWAWIAHLIGQIWKHAQWISWFYVRRALSSQFTSIAICNNRSNPFPSDHILMSCFLFAFFLYVAMYTLLLQRCAHCQMRFNEITCWVEFDSTENNCNTQHRYSSMNAMIERHFVVSVHRTSLCRI